MRVGTTEVRELGSIKSSLVASLTKSSIICNHPLRPAIEGPNRRCACAKNFRSTKTTNKQNKIKTIIKIKARSDNILLHRYSYKQVSTADIKRTQREDLNNTLKNEIRLRYICTS